MEPVKFHGTKVPENNQAKPFGPPGSYDPNHQMFVREGELDPKWLRFMRYLVSQRALEQAQGHSSGDAVFLVSALGPAPKGAYSGGA